MTSIKSINTSVISFCFTFILFSGFSFSQTSYLDSLDGKYALQFQVSDNFNLTNFQGTTFSGKYHSGKRSAIRVGLTVNYNNADVENSETLLDTNLVISGDGNQNVFGMTIRTQYIHYIPGTYDITFFAGGGPFVGFNNGTSETNQTNYDPQHREQTIDDFFAGLDLLVGVEWMFTKNMSLSAEYGIRFSYQSETRNWKDEHSVRETSSKNYNIGKGDINFGLSVYF